MQELKIGCVLLAAGRAARFGGDKLMAEYNGKPLYERALRCVPTEELYRVAVVTGNCEIETAAVCRRLDVVRNEQPELGLSRSVQLGLGLVKDCDAVMFMVADQPCLTKESVLRLLRLYRAQPDRITALGCGERRGNPAIFPKKYYPALMALGGDAGGSAVIKAHEDALLLCQVPELELVDVDTAAELEKLKKNE